MKIVDQSLKKVLEILSRKTHSHTNASLSHNALVCLPQENPSIGYATITLIFSPQLYTKYDQMVALNKHFKIYRPEQITSKYV